MSGGGYEYTAAYVNNGNDNLGTYGASLISADNKYKDVYISSGDTQAGNYAANSNKKGDAVYETSLKGNEAYSWYADYSYMPYSAIPFFVRGGYYDYMTGAGAFAFYYYVGAAASPFGFRPVLVLASSL